MCEVVCVDQRTRESHGCVCVFVCLDVVRATSMRVCQGNVREKRRVPSERSHKSAGRADERASASASARAPPSQPIISLQ
jgi:hypothetical protein